MVSRTKSPAGRRHRSKPPPATTPLVLDADRYGGKWIATVRGHVVAQSEDLKEVDALVREMGLADQAILTLVPKTGDLVV